MGIKSTREDKTTRGIADVILETFYNCVTIDKMKWQRNNDLSYYNEVMSFLIAEGFLKETPYSFEITYKGRLKVDDGGFVGSFKRERSSLFWSRFAAIVSLAAAVSSIVALVFAIGK